MGNQIAYCSNTTIVNYYCAYLLPDSLRACLILLVSFVHSRTIEVLGYPIFRIANMTSLESKYSPAPHVLLSELSRYCGDVVDPARRAFLICDDIPNIRCSSSRAMPIAAVHGIVIGLGIDIISACDVRHAASDAKFSIKAR
ncbi:uncharacterized protein F5891DRAFT_1003512 [Suillus fuscotomentosus]|uniref:Uncharacterized protein n=1 Tax=Suillus fuscotomentosus TaxID=1912939 RepID=A0AAD4EIK0_9AGAM|nr:uncharacterized protein F5891DRAFT_1003512 [Suillus fuscotomentosus]KAG1906711.1 hypothetical protein F5891DRAFT_1003512 [Suillus fuscotomentosus]